MNELNVNLRGKRSYASRFEFLCENYREGWILDVGNVGGLMGKGHSNSSHLKFKEKISEYSVLCGFDLFPPAREISSQFQNQVKGNLEGDLPYSNESFDTVYAGQVLEHMGNPLSILKEFNRILKSDGILILDVPNPYGVKKILKWIIHREEKWGDPTHMIMFTPTSLKALLFRADFKNIQVAGDRKIGILWPFGKSGLGGHLLCCAEKK